MERRQYLPGVVDSRSSQRQRYQIFYLGLYQAKGEKPKYGIFEDNVLIQ